MGFFERINIENIPDHESTYDQYHDILWAIALRCRKVAILAHHKFAKIAWASYCVSFIGSGEFWMKMRITSRNWMELKAGTGLPYPCLGAHYQWGNLVTWRKAWSQARHKGSLHFSIIWFANLHWLHWNISAGWIAWFYDGLCTFKEWFSFNMPRLKKCKIRRVNLWFDTACISIYDLTQIDLSTLQLSWQCALCEY
jgi:hypothetical protein